MKSNDENLIQNLVEETYSQDEGDQENRPTEKEGLLLHFQARQHFDQIAITRFSHFFRLTWKDQGLDIPNNYLFFKDIAETPSLQEAVYIRKDDEHSHFFNILKCWLDIDQDIEALEFVQKDSKFLLHLHAH